MASQPQTNSGASAPLFCNVCNNLLKYEYSPQGKEGIPKLRLVCSCGNEQKLTVAPNSRTKYGKIEELNVSPMFCYSSDLMRTRQYKCPNENCPSNRDPKIGINPEMVIFQYDSNLGQGLICCECQSHYRF